ncbi:MAG: hypothetical protein ACR2HR_08655 [Euzebya sp.]
MDDHDITDFVNALTDAAPFAGRGTSEASAVAGLLAFRRAGWVEDWVECAVDALAGGMRADHQPPVARAILQTPDGVWIDEADACCATSWFVERLQARVRAAEDVWVALAVPDTDPHRIPIGGWNPLNLGHGVIVTDVRWFVEVRGRRLGLDRGRLLCTGLRPLIDGDGPEIRGTDDPALLRLGRRILHGHPVRR